MVEIFILIILGIIAGCFTGLIPGIHVNMIAATLIATLPYWLEVFDPFLISIFIVCMAVTHTFLDAIPSIYLGAPNPDTALSILPGHKMLLEGNGHAAVFLMTMGSFFAVIILLILAPLMIITSKTYYPLIKDFIPFILITASIILILKEDRKIIALLFFMLSGALGIAVLTNYSIKQGLFPLFSGLFGASTLLISLTKKFQVPKQKLDLKDMGTFGTLGGLIKGLLAATLCGFLPGLGAAEAAILVLSTEKNPTKEKFLVTIGSINTYIVIISFIAFFTIDRARNGAVVAIQQIIKHINNEQLSIIFVVSLITACVATILTILVSKKVSVILNKIDYRKLSLAIIVLITILVGVISGWIGLIILITATSIGIAAPLLNIHRSQLMGSLILPVILFFLL